MVYGRLDAARKLGPSEYDDDDLGWAGRGDLGANKGRVLSGGERAALLRREAREAMERAGLRPPALGWAAMQGCRRVA